MLIKPSPSTRDNIGGSIIKLARNEQDHVHIYIYTHTDRENKFFHFDWHLKSEDYQATTKLRTTNTSTDL
jgi:hypothetical protein